MRSSSPFVVRGRHRPCSDRLRHVPSVPRGAGQISRRRRTTERTFRSEPPATPAPPSAPPPRPPIVRLRYVLAAGLLACTAYAVVPRAIAYWQLHSAATQFANYALCMVGPTGPGLLREQPREFWRLVRRRLVAADPDARPFERCLESLEAFEPNASRRAAHRAPAREFVEYTAFSGEAVPELSMDDLRVTTARLESLVEQSSPLAQKGFAPLVRPSRNARAVPHPIELPRPAWGSGLPHSGVVPAAVLPTEQGVLLVTGRDVNLSAHVSWDGGISWSPTDAEDERIQALSGLCSAGRDAPAFRLVYDESRLRVESWLQGSLETSFPVASADRSLVGFSCDHSAALVATADDQGRGLALRLCKHVHRCQGMALPTPLEEPRPSDGTFSLARVHGVTVLALARGGIVRVISSRDDGESWTPSTVAYDALDYGDSTPSFPTPDRLLALDERLLLYAGVRRRGARYPVLLSDDYGASWRSGEKQPEATSLAERATR